MSVKPELRRVWKMRQTLRNDQLSAADLGFLQIILGLGLRASIHR
jgi:hypothetical protein